MIETETVHAYRATAEVLTAIGLDESVAGGTVNIIGDDFPEISPHRLASASSGALAALGISVTTLWRRRGGDAQDISVDSARALQGLRCSHYTRKNGRRLDFGGGPLYNYHETRDGKWIDIYGNHNYGRFLDAALDVLQCQHNSASIDQAILKWNGEDLEDALNSRGVPSALARTDVEWANHPQGKWLAETPLIEIDKIGDSPPEPIAPGFRPLSGIRVLDVAHVICGPMVSRTLAEQGADVLRLASTACRDRETTLIDTGWGKRSAYIDLYDSADVERTLALAAHADVLVQSFRPGALARRGLSCDAIAGVRPGIIYVSVSAYGDGGPWGSRGGFETLGQAVAGLTMAEAFEGRPRWVRTDTLNDYLAAYLAAAGAVSALLRRWTEGGSYHVKVSFARTSMWVRELGTIPGAEAYLGLPYKEPAPPECSPRSHHSER